MTNQTRQQGGGSTTGTAEPYKESWGCAILSFCVVQLLAHSVARAFAAGH
jgi:hypothetical protein